MLRYRLSAAAQSDIVEILSWSQRQFGAAARRRYERLIVGALQDLATNPDRAGSRARPELGAGARSWHLRLSVKRAGSGAGRVRTPRHFIVYRMEGTGVLAIGRVLHEAMDVEDRIPGEEPWG